MQDDVSFQEIFTEITPQHNEIISMILYVKEMLPDTDVAVYLPDEDKLISNSELHLALSKHLDDFARLYRDKQPFARLEPDGMVLYVFFIEKRDMLVICKLLRDEASYAELQYREFFFHNSIVSAIFVQENERLIVENQQVKRHIDVLKKQHSELIEQNHKLYMNSQQKERLYAVQLEEEVKNRTEELSKALRHANDLTKQVSASRDEAEKLNSELKQQIIYAKEMANRAQEAGRAKSQFLAMMSHEIRTPMNGVLGMLTLLMDTPLSDEQKDYAATARSSAESLLTILNDILDFSKIEAGKLAIESIDFNFNSMFQAATAVMAIKIKEKGLKFFVSVEEGIPENFKGDPNRIRQVLVNLIGNAIKFTETGSIQVSVSIISDIDGIVMLRFAVMDTGIGISKNQQKNLFRMFSQADTSTTRKYGGTGLGLAISKQLVELMGGQIGVESEENKGSEFWFSLPLTKVEVAVREQKMPVSDLTKTSVSEKEVKILVAEDNLINQMVASAFFKKLGYKIELATNGIEAIKALTTCGYDLVFMDIEMPEMDGIEATRNIRSGANGILKPDVPIIAMTAHAIKSYYEKCLEAGMNDYITKPLIFDSLKQKVEKWVQK